MALLRHQERRRGPDGCSGLRRPLFPGLLLLGITAACTFERQPAEDVQESDAGVSVEEAVEEMLHASAGSWNGGDLDGFMDDYWRSGNLTFSGSGGVTRGWENVRDRYLRSYWAPGASRDSLRFEGIEVLPLGPDHALALGRYVLYQPGEDAVTSTGHFSLVLRRIEGRWTIVHDHTSAAGTSGAPAAETDTGADPGS